MFFLGVLSLFKIEYRVVDFPLPVGPVTSIMPKGFSMASWKSSSGSGKNPIASRPMLKFALSSALKTTLLPKPTGRTETLKSISLPRVIILKRPSCGMRDSVMSIFDIILSLATTAF